MGAAMRLVYERVTTVWNDGRDVDLGNPDPEIVCFAEIGNTLSKIARFNGRNRGVALSVAQHSVMGAQALLSEKANELEAALFLLHDAHEWALGDLVRPSAELFAAACSELYGETHLLDAISACKSAWDEAIYFAAGLPGPEAWTRRQAKLVKDMDARMQRAEAISLFGAGAASKFPKSATPKLTGAIKPWPAGKAEEQFMAMARRLIGEERILDRVSLAALRRAL